MMKQGLEKLRSRLVMPAPGHYLIGLSGGADSVALLMMILPEIQSGRMLIEAVHVNHGLRGAESDEDQRFTAGLCKEAGIRFHSRRVDLNGHRDEGSARKARYDCFRQILKETGAEGMMLAHHADDQAETFLLHLLRGSGGDGLSGMKPDSWVAGIRLIRPMLRLRRSEIREALREEGIPWREDASNENTVYLRNRIRLELLPELEGFASGATERICQAAELIGDDNAALNAEAERMLRRVAREDWIETETIEAAPAALQSRVLRLWWTEQGPPRKEHGLNTRQTAELLSLLQMDRGQVNLPGNLHVIRSPRMLHLAGRNRPALSPVRFEPPETCFGSYRLTQTDSEGSPGDGRRCQEVPPGFAEGCEIRTRRPGDWIYPFGSLGWRKLQDYLTDRRIPAPFRDRIPLLCRENEVLLVAGVGAGRIPSWTQPSVRLTWDGDMPWMIQD